MTTKASEQVAGLEQSLDESLSLCGEVLATLRINYDRGHLWFRAEDGRDTITNEQFAKWLEQWRERLDAINGRHPEGV
jgi:truncated hemoglobin YjbI